MLVRLLYAACMLWISLPAAAQTQTQTMALGAQSVVNLHRSPEVSSELVSQSLLGLPLRCTPVDEDWVQVETLEGYQGYVTRLSVAAVDSTAFAQWKQAPRLMVTEAYVPLRTRPSRRAPVVAEAVAGGVLECKGRRGAWWRALLPGGEEVWLPHKAATPLAAYLQTRRNPRPQDLIQTAYRFVGVPYLWGGFSTKGLDCSGFTKLVYHLNGLVLLRDASQQFRSGEALPLVWEEGGPQTRGLAPADLIFFGRLGTEGRPPKVSHVGLYLGEGLFLHASTRVREGALRPDHARFYARSTGLVGAVRILGTQDSGLGVLSLARHPWMF